MRSYVMLYILFVSMFIFSPVLWGQDEVLVEYTFTGETTQAEMVNSYLNASKFELSSGSVGFGSAHSGTWTGSGVPYAEGSGSWDEENAEEAKHFYFVLEGLGETTFSITNVSFWYRVTGAGPSALTLTLNGDDKITIDVVDGDTFDFNYEVSGYNDLSEVTIKIKGWDNDSRETTGGGDFRVNDVLVKGVVESSGPNIIHTTLEDTDSTEDRTVTATITGDGLITENNNRPVLWYSTDSGDGWNHTYYLDKVGDDFEFELPGQTVGTEVLYYIAAKDADGVTTNPFGGSGNDPPGNEAPDTYHSYTILEPPPDELQIILSRDPEDTSEENRVHFPFAGMGDEEGEIERINDEDDWTYINPQFTFYAVAEGDEEIIAAEFYIEWDHTKVTVEVEEGNYFEGENPIFHVSEDESGRYHVNAASTQGNVAPFNESHIAKVTVTVNEPGYHEITITDVDLRYYDEENDQQIELPSITYPGEIKFYLGDFGRDDNGGANFEGDRGDGKIDFADLMLFGSAYWSERGINNEYRTKFDIGPTDQGGSYFMMPSSDGVIDFEDLVIFAIGYYKSADGELEKQMTEPVRIVVYEIEEQDNSVIVPLGFEDAVNDVRALTLEIGYPNSALSFREAAPVGELDQEMGFYASREIDGRVQLDAAIIREAFSQEGVFAYLHFDKDDSFDPAAIGLISAEARNSNNDDIPVEISRYTGDPDAQRPATFNLSQNYPNPFNPVTTIEYQLPEDTRVSIVIYNILGAKVAELVNENQESGYHSVEWNGTTLDNLPAPSGVYIYRIQAGDYSETKRMMLLK